MTAGKTAFFKPIKPMKLTSIISKYLDGYGETKRAIEGTGLSRDTINSMKRGGETRISKFIKLANFLGWQIIIRTKDEEIEITE